MGLNGDDWEADVTVVILSVAAEQLLEHSRKWGRGGDKRNIFDTARMLVESMRCHWEAEDVATGMAAVLVNAMQETDARASR